MQDFKSQKIKSVIKDLLKKKGINYEELAEQMECSVPTIKRILGPEELTLNRLLQLCEIVEIDLAELEVLTQENQEEPAKFTTEQETFLSKNKSFFAYLMKLVGGETPKQIAEKNNLTQRSTDKYLIGLEKQGLIRVTGRQKVRPNFKGIPFLDDGPLGRIYYQAFIDNAAGFFVRLIREGMSSPENKQKRERTMFGIQAAKVSEPTYRAFVEERERAMRNFEKMASFEEKTKDPSELMTAVIVQANSYVDNDYKGLSVLENTMGEITNL